LLPIVALASGLLPTLLRLILFAALISTGWVDWYACHHQSAISAVIMLLGGLLARLHNDSNMASIVLVIFFCLAVMPTLLMGSLLFVLETSALAESRKAN